MLAIAAMAFATLAPFALAAEGQDDDPDKPTMAKLEGKINGISSQIVRLEATVGTLRTELGTLASTVTANHTTIVGKFAQQTAAVMTVPTTSTGVGYRPAYYLVGDSSIAGFPAGTVGANGSLGRGNQALPAGTYLFELQHPYSDNVLCNRSVAKRHLLGGNRFNNACPRLRLHLHRTGHLVQRFDDGPVVADIAAGVTFLVLHKFPTGFAFTDDKPVTSYGGAVRITKLK